MKEIEKQEWSEEDEKYLNLAINIVASDFGEDSPTVSFLKSLRPQPHWKPSDEQMEALVSVLDYLDESDNEDADIVRELINDLQKLL